MNIPDILRGKVAKPFIEWFSDQFTHGIDGYKSYADAPRLVTNALGARAFLSSPFAIEMIPEIFEGWEVCGSDFFEIVNKHHSVTMDYYPREGKMIFYDYGVEVSTTNPKTWNQFISDCKRVGIKLKYK